MVIPEVQELPVVEIQEIQDPQEIQEMPVVVDPQDPQEIQEHQVVAVAVAREEPSSQYQPSPVVVPLEETPEQRAAAAAAQVETPTQPGAETPEGPGTRGGVVLVVELDLQAVLAPQEILAPQAIPEISIQRQTELPEILVVHRVCWGYPSPEGLEEMQVREIQVQLDLVEVEEAEVLLEVEEMAETVEVLEVVELVEMVAPTTPLPVPAEVQEVFRVPPGEPQLAIILLLEELAAFLASVGEAVMVDLVELFSQIFPLLGVPEVLTDRASAAAVVVVAAAQIQEPQEIQEIQEI